MMFVAVALSANFGVEMLLNKRIILILILYLKLVLNLLIIRISR